MRFKIERGPKRRKKKKFTSSFDFISCFASNFDSEFLNFKIKY